MLLDSVIVIDHLNGVAEATRFLGEHDGPLRISAVTRAEVLSGYAEEERVPVVRLLDRFALVAIDAPVADLAADLRYRYRWKLPDALQAAAALAHGLRLATRDTKAFSPERHAFVHVPYCL